MLEPQAVPDVEVLLHISHVHWSPYSVGMHALAQADDPGEVLDHRPRMYVRAMPSVCPSSLSIALDACVYISGVA